MEYTELSIQKALTRFFASSTVRYDINGLYVFGWESDKLIETRSGYIYEFEIKISRSDYKNDFKHKVRKHYILAAAVGCDTERKEMLINYCKERQKKYPRITPAVCLEELSNPLGQWSRMPNYFYYAVPHTLIDVSEVPPYAGLIYVDAEMRPIVVKKAPCLHKIKYTDSELGLCEKFYYNMIRQRGVINNCRKLYDDIRARLDEELKSKGRDMTFSQIEKALKEEQEKSKKAKDLADMYKSLWLEATKSADLFTVERRIMVEKIKAYEPDFDYLKVMEEADRKYEEKYGKGSL